MYDTPLDFAVIGAQKAGSTFVQRALADHPEIIMPRGETNAFHHPDYGPEPVQELEAMRQAAAGRLFGIKRPNYLARPETPGLLARHAPAAKLVVVLREPIARAVSAALHYMRAGFIPVTDVEVALSRALRPSLAPESPAYVDLVDYGRYATHLERYHAHFAPEQFHVMLFESLRSDPRVAFAGLYAWLGVDASHEPRTLDERPMATVSSSWRLRGQQLVDRRLVRFNANQTRRYSPSVGPKRWAAKAYAGADRYILARLLPGKDAALGEEVRGELAELYRPEVACLRTMLGEPLVGWP